MAKTRTTLTIDEDVFRAVKLKAARTGKRDSQVIEESLRRDLGLGDLEDIWAQVNPASEEEGLRLAYSELHAMREEKGKRETGRP
jgi:gamma-glutamyl:cysteine ligase YbdK (ATP-grasp superfamily)